MRPIAIPLDRPDNGSVTDTPDIRVFDSRARGDWVRLRTLVLLRWIAVAGQTAAVLFGTQVLDLRLPLPECAALISASVALNIGATLVHPGERRLSEKGSFFSMAFDLVQLMALLMLTGGLNNPFAVLILAPVTISATALRLKSIVMLGLVALAGIVLMATVYRPLILADGSALTAPALYRYGMAAALAIGVVFLALYARRVTVEAARMSEALNATQIALGREQRLAAIGSNAAATAHELGTPLATIKLVATELARELKGQNELAEDAALIRREAERCGAIMADLGRGGREDAHVKRAPISAVIEEAAAPHADRGIALVLRIEGLVERMPDEPEPSISRRPELIHGLRNIIQNAVDFAEATVWIDVEQDEAGLRISVGDDGPGFSPDILPSLAEPYVSSRARGQGKDQRYEGLGLGLFIARTLLERTGARLSFANGTDARQRRRRAPAPSAVAHPPGAIIEIFWRDISVIGLLKNARDRSQQPRNLANNSSNSKH